MSSHFMRLLLAGGVAAIGLNAMAATADHLVVSEVGMNGGPNNEGEYIEIYNPTTSSVPLDNYWLSDSNTYSSLPSDADGLIDAGTTDNIIKFPNGSSLASGQVAVIVGNANTFLTNHFSGNLSNFTSQAGSPLLFEVTESNGSVPNVEIHSNNGTTPNNWNFTNASATNGEFVRIFWWDGVADLVKDVDTVAWGTPSGGNSPASKTPATAGGKNGATYAQDNGSLANLTVGSVALATRTSIVEGNEPTTGGNGITGHDESMEDNSASWVGGSFPANATPGITGLTVNTGNAPPLIDLVDRNIMNPTSSQQVVLSVSATDTDGSIASARFFVDSGSGYTQATAALSSGTTWSATVGPFANGTVIKYYAEVTDNGGATSKSPSTAPTQFKQFLVTNSPILAGDLVINEIQYDAIGADNVDAPEWVEIYNTKNTPIDLSHISFADGNKNWFTFPASTTIPANGYVVVSLNDVAFTTTYGSLPAGVNLFDWGTFAFNNDTDQVFLRYINGWDFNGIETYVDYVNYTNADPWPTLSSNRTLELINPASDNSLPQSWAANTNTISPNSTPGAVNSVFAGVIISNVSRNIELPAANQAVQISATIVPAVPSQTISSAKVYVDTGSGFVATNMTANGTTYTATIGGWPASTRVKYYVEATNNASQTGVYPALAPTNFLVFYAGATVPAAGQLVINEILYDNFDADNYEFVEILNTTASPIDMSDFVFTDGGNNPVYIPQGTIISANGYVVLTMDEPYLSSQYIVPGGVPKISWDRKFNLNNDGDTVSIYHPNLYKTDGSGTPVSRVAFTVLAPWPTWTNAPSNTEPESPNQTGRTIELINPLSPNRETGVLWGWTTRVEPDGPTTNMGSPGRQNSIYSTSAVSDWTLY